MKEIKSVDVRRSAMDLLARREHTQQELFSKLYDKFTRKISHRFPVLEGSSSIIAEDFSADYLESLIKDQIQILTDENLQSDERFVESFINGRKSKGKGPRVIRLELMTRGVDGQLIESYLEEASSEWFDLAAKTYKKKFGNQPAVEPNEKAKRQRFMLHRGFLYEHFSDLMRISAVI